MKKESLEQARKDVIKALKESKIEKVDKGELMLNLWILLSDEHYEKDIKYLIKKRGKKYE